MRGITFFRASGRGNGCGIFMGMSENGDGFGFCFLAVCAMERFDTCFGFSRFFGNFTVIPSMTFGVDVTVNVGITAGTFMRGITFFGAGRLGYGVRVDMSGR